MYAHIYVYIYIHILNENVQTLFFCCNVCFQHPALQRTTKTLCFGTPCRSKNCQKRKVEEEVLRLVAKGAFDKKSPAWLALPREARDRELLFLSLKSGEQFLQKGLRIESAGNDGNKSCIHIS